METKNLFNTQAGQYREFRPDYPDSLVDYIVSNTVTRTHAWDAGTGNGQLAVRLTEHFDRITATDVSQDQIKQASPHEKITYRVAEAESTGLVTTSVDLITVAQALHWFDLSVFFREVERVLKPGGFFCAISYALPSINEEVDRNIQHLHTNILADYWPEQRKLVDEQYRSIQLPWQEQTVPAMQIHRQWTLQEFLSYLYTWSAVVLYRQENDSDPVSRLRDTITPYWNDGIKLDVFWPLTIKAAHKPV